MRQIKSISNLHGDGEVDDGGPSRDLWRVCGVAQLGGDVQPEALHHVYFLVAHFHLMDGK